MNEPRIENKCACVSHTRAHTQYAEKYRPIWLDADQKPGNQFYEYIWVSCVRYIISLYAYLDFGFKCGLILCARDGMTTFN